ncbi:LysR family transcriptional regulator [Pseudomonas sp. SZMC_28357]|uniref:LysR family transcriptional regulator n=1 Tax=Pseudomonas sp. SZMC_28357 TaxID=3074380 RepID=UPI002871D6BF|nr:LysR family transcriptional regulator [Pseudomonas sp. SZMC_28357]MDR9753371.1 LysR family transcriptional regulator [Pseudomonas sp. SZMC_28357]
MRGSEFSELKAFVAVVERQSFARAAEHLGLSPSALSQTIRQLESRIGSRLLNRTTRSVAPSASGELLYQRLAPLFRDMDVAVAEASEAAGQMSGTLRINTLGLGARTIIAPRLARFHQAHPDVVLDIVVDDALADIVTGRFDAGIRVGGQLEKDMVAIRLTPDMNMVVVASPDYLARHGTPKSPADLHQHACINWRLQMEGRRYRWEFKKREQSVEVAVDGPVVTNHADIGIAAALNGLGLAYHFEQDGVGELLEQGAAGPGLGRLVDYAAWAFPVLPR